ncbi:MAG: phosphate ABC transporter permease PstA [Acidobacteriota bacterium]
MSGLRDLVRRGDPAIWLAGTGLAVCLLMIGGMIALILTSGLGFFWPATLVEVTLKNGTVLLGEVASREAIPAPGSPDRPVRFRTQLKLGNRDLFGADYRWVDEDDIVSRAWPADAVYVERREYGPLIGRIVKVTDGTRDVATGSGPGWDALEPLLDQASRDRAAIRRLERDEIGAINARLEQTRLALKTQPAARAGLERDAAALTAQYSLLEQRLGQQTDEAGRTRVTVKVADGREKDLATLDVFRAYRANQLTTTGRAAVYASRLWEFLSGDPRESNTEGGIFPAIFGTLMMVILMSVVAVPFGVVAALYLREYAKQGVLVRFVRIAVNNLAGVPSIVFGVFGLGFFVYLLGGTIDRLFYADRLPTPTFGTGGILWASLTLGLLTVPVVIVAAEEALAAVPRSMREASLATGATKFQTILRVVLPAAAPGILTGLILAMARGAGEVAPLMITGVVKLAPDLPLDWTYPFLHLERKFMHLGFHIYDVGFQSPNVEAAKPMVYATAVLLLVIVVLLNLTAIVVRTRLRRKYQTSAF